MSVSKYPYHIRLPEETQSPTNSVYHTYDVIEQKAVLVRHHNDSRTIRSAKPFKLRFLVGDKIKEVVSRKSK